MKERNLELKEFAFKTIRHIGGAEAKQLKVFIENLRLEVSRMVREYPLDKSIQYYVYVLLPELILHHREGKPTQLVFVKEKEYYIEESSTGVDIAEETGTIHQWYDQGFETTPGYWEKEPATIKVIRGEASNDKAMSKEDVGGIDFNDVNVKRQGNGVQMRFDAEAMAPLLKMDIDGLVPIMFNMTPIQSVLPLLGLAIPKEEETEKIVQHLSDGDKPREMVEVL